MIQHVSDLLIYPIFTLKRKKLSKLIYKRFNQLQISPYSYKKYSSLRIETTSQQCFLSILQRSYELHTSPFSIVDVFPRWSFLADINDRKRVK